MGLYPKKENKKNKKNKCLTVVVTTKSALKFPKHKKQ